MAYIKEDKKALIQLYERMGNNLAAELNADWTEVCLGFFVDEHGQETMLIYVSYDGGDTWHDFMEDVFAADEIMTGVFDCKECCQELHDLCAKSGDKWTSFTLTMDAEGHFKAEFGYDPFDKMIPLLKAIWMGEHLE